MFAVPGAASAAGSSINATITTNQPAYQHMNGLCVAGSETTHYRLIQARIIGTSASVLSATVTPSGFRANLGVYDGAFMPDMPIVNCMGNPSGSGSGAPVTYSIPTPSLTEFPGITERSYVFVVAGHSAGDLGAFSLSVTSSNATAVELTDITDVTPPELTVPSSMTLEATKPAGAEATFTVSANDAVDGVRPVVCVPASGSTFPIARTRVNCTASDLSDNVGTRGFNVTVKDTTAPVMTLPSPPTAEANTPEGAVVTYEVTASDLVDGSRPVTCTPASGSTFPRGTTTVSCASSDTRNNTTTKTLEVKVTNGPLPVTGELTVGGTAKVGSTLTSTSTLTTTPAATRVTGQWLRGSEEIASATDSAYTLVAADEGKTITFRQTLELVGYKDAIGTSNAVGPVEPGDISLDKPSVQGSAKVGATLTAEPGQVAPLDVTQTYEWFSGSDSLGSGASYTVKAADLGKSIHVVATGTKNGYTTTSQSSVATAAVVTGTMTSSGAVTVDGVAKVGQMLSATSQVTTVPAADGVSGQWFRDAEAIASATDPVYAPTNADAGSELTYVETHTKPGYEPMVVSSNATAKISGGVIALPVPTVTGNYVVDETLVATTPGLAPADATLSYAWSVDGQQAGTGATYTLKPGDVGKTVALMVSASKPYFDSADSGFGPSAQVEKASFDTGPIAAISGVFMVGEKLTAVEGPPAPKQDSFAYQWFANGDPIEAATSRTLVLARAQDGAKISVEVTAKRAGYVDASDKSAESAVVVGRDAPTVSLKPAAAKLRLGQSTVLTWSSTNAISVEASGSWSGRKMLSGSQKVKPTTIGTSKYVLRAKNNAGTTTAQVAVPVALPAKTFRMAGKWSLRADRSFGLKASGLARSEKYTVRLGGKVFASGRATKAGRIDRELRVPSSVGAGKRVLRVIGSQPDRTGFRKIEVVRTKTIKMVFRAASVRAWYQQQVIVSKLLPGEKVTLTYKGRRISKKSARANSKGVFTMTFNVGADRGRHTVKASAASARKPVKKTFTVIR